jgi:hypothetical protein
MAELVETSDIDIFLTDAAWAFCSTYHTVLKASPGAAIFELDMLFDILFIADWQKIGENRQWLADLNNVNETKAELIMIIRLVRKYCYGTKVFSTKQSPGIRKSLGWLCQSIQMEQSRFNTKTN